jgi:hypothetical protein
MKTLKFLLLLILTTGISYGQNWQTLNSGVEVGLIGIFFTSDNIGYAVGGEGKIIKTTDAGNTWQQQNSGVTVSLTKVFFVDANTGYCGGFEGTFWRHNVAGDLPGTNNTIDHHLLNQLVKANKGKQGFTFTHKPVGYSGQALVNARAIYAANKQGFTINLSAEGLKEADRLYDLSIAPVVIVVPSDAPKHMRTPKGRRVVTCPAENSNITCNDCRLCANSNRKGIVAFRAHGSKRNSINKLLKVIQ